MDETPTNAVEELVRDGVAEVKARGLIPRPSDVKKYVTGIVEKVERQDAEQRLRIKPKPVQVEREVTRSSDEFEREYQKRLRARGMEPLPGSWNVTRQAAQPGKVELDMQRTALAKRRMRERLRLLRSKPDWAAKLKTINPLALQGQLGPDKKKHAEFLVREVIKSSEAVFGPWWRQKAKKLYGLPGVDK